MAGVGISTGAFACGGWAGRADRLSDYRAFHFMLTVTWQWRSAGDARQDQQSIFLQVEAGQESRFCATIAVRMSIPTQHATFTPKRCQLICFA